MNRVCGSRHVHSCDTDVSVAFISSKSVEVLDAVDPLVLLLRRGGGDSVDHVIALHHSSVSFRFTRLNELPSVIRDVELEAVLHETTTTTTKKSNNASKQRKIVITLLLGNWGIHRLIILMFKVKRTHETVSQIL